MAQLCAPSTTLSLFLFVKFHDHGHELLAYYYDPNDLLGCRWYWYYEWKRNIRNWDYIKIYQKIWSPEICEICDIYVG